MVRKAIHLRTATRKIAYLVTATVVSLASHPSVFPDSNRTDVPGLLSQQTTAGRAGRSDDPSAIPSDSVPTDIGSL